FPLLRLESRKLDEVRLRLLRVLVLDVQEILPRRELIEVPEACGWIGSAQLEDRFLSFPSELSVDVDSRRFTLAEHDRPRHRGPQADPLVLDRRPVRRFQPELEGVEQVEEQRFLAAVGEPQAQIDKLLLAGRWNLALRITDNLELHISHANGV